MKTRLNKITCILASIVTAIITISPVYVSATTYETWAPSPTFSTGITQDHVRVFNAYAYNTLQMHRLSGIGSNYYLALATHNYLGGANGTTSLSKYYPYVLLDNGTTFVVASKRDLSTNIQYGKYTVNVKDLTSQIGSTYYTSNGYDVPVYVVSFIERALNCDEGERLIITKTGKIHYICLNRKTDNASYYQYEMVIRNGVLYRAQMFNVNSNGTISTYTLPSSGTRAAALTPFQFSGSSMTYGSTTTDVSVLGLENKSEGVFVKHLSNMGTVTNSSLSWWNRNAQLPDGRTPTASWFSMGGGGSSYEMWYDVSGGNTLAFGPSGYVSATNPTLKTYALNNSKFIITQSIVDTNYVKEYYRVTQISENASGELEMSGGSLGKKIITQPDGSETTPVQPDIDFDQDDLPIGFKINNNAITSSKLESLLRQQINSVRLNDIVVLKKSGAISGSQNVGFSLSTYGYTDYSMGSTFNFICNGQNFNWFCDYPENLSVGKHSKSFVVGDKTLYVNINVVAAPSNSGATTVVF